MLKTFTDFDGIPSMRDSEIMELYDRIQEEGTDYIFQDGDIQTRDDLLSMVKSSKNFFYLVGEKGRSVGIVWLNRVEHKMARLHFLAFREVWGRSVNIAKNVIINLLSIQHRNGEHYFNVLTGHIPSKNHQAICFMKKCGCTVVGEVPHLMWNEANQESEPGTIVYITREAFK